MASSTESRVAIIIGATSGIGLDLAKHLLTKDWKIACTGRRQSAGTQLLIDLDTTNAEFYAADVSKYEDSVAVFQKVFQRWGRIDAVCVNAGIVDQSSIYIYETGSQKKTIEDVPPAPDTSVIDINYKGVVYCTQLATHFMRYNPQRGGRVIITGSIGGVFPHESYPVYCGTKSAVNQFVRGAAPLLKIKENILLNVVMPGMVNTPIVPPEMIAAVSPECLTPVKTILRAYDVFLDDTTGMAGQLLEGSAENLIYYLMPEPGNGRITERAVTVWEPLFEMMHGEKSGLPGAIP
ncbi:Short-chain dehydrogenase/reductase SDR [Penicillium verhagenii]|nr:Short-chain dehydrogenase/reductase SDR [Penicillium verhagenii]